MPRNTQRTLFVFLKAHYPAQFRERYHRSLFAPVSRLKAADATQQPRTILKNKKCNIAAWKLFMVCIGSQTGRPAQLKMLLPCKKWSDAQ